MSDSTQQLSKPTLVIIVAIVLLAFILRLLLTIERADFDPQFIPSAGFDQETYVAQARGLLDGTWPTEPYYFHPAPAYIFALLLSFVGDSVAGLYIAVGALDALTCVALIGAGWLLSRKAWGGYLAGLLYAIYPAAIIYGTSLLIVPLATGILAWLTVFTIWQREKVVWWRTIMAGIFAGLLMISRLNLVPIVALYGLWLLMLRVGWRTWIVHCVAYGSIALSIVAPFTLHNWQASDGALIPVATTGPLELYMGNNRDSNGQHGGSRALETADIDYIDALIRDVEVAPQRFVGLMLYKFARFWHRLEVPSNLDIDDLRAQSEFLRYNPLSYWWLMLPALLGLSVLWYRDRQAALVLSLMLGWMCASYMVTFAYSRFRHPGIVPLIVLASYWLTIIISWLYKVIQTNESGEVGTFREWSWSLRRYLIPIILIVGVLGFSMWALEPVPKIPPKPQYDTLPVDAYPLNIVYDETIELVGWRPVDAWPASRNGWLMHGQAYTVELFWRVHQPTEEQYFFYLSYLSDGVRYAGLDNAIGGISFPFVTTDLWAVDGTLHSEIVSVLFDENVPTLQSGSMLVGAYYWDTEGLIVNVAGEVPTLQTIAAYENITEPQTLPDEVVVFGDKMTLMDFDVPSQTTISSTIEIEMEWQALDNIETDYTLFLHVVDETDTIIAQGDTFPTPNLATSNWQPHHHHSAMIPLMMPDAAGEYALYAGLYTAEGRLAVEDSDRLLLGTIVVE